MFNPKAVGVGGLLVLGAAWFTTIKPAYDGFNVGRPIVNGECYGYAAGWGCFSYGVGAGVRNWMVINDAQFYQGNPQWENRTKKRSGSQDSKEDGREGWGIGVPGFGGGGDKEKEESAANN